MGEGDDRGMSYTFELNNVLLTQIDVFEKERGDFWEGRLGEEEWSRTLEMQRNADELARQIMQHAASLASPTAGPAIKDFRQLLEEYRQRVIADAEKRFHQIRDKVPSEAQRAVRDALRTVANSWSIEEIDSALEQDAPLRLVWERFCIDLAREALEDRLLPAAKRLFLLMNLVTEVEPGAKTTQFLRHVSRCYLWGFDSECLILCRSSIDTAFWDAVSDELCAARRDKPGRRFGLQDRIEAALPTIIDNEIYNAAIRVKLSGDRAVHDDPQAGTNVLATIRDTLKIIRKLSA
jgi:hypothetical protein